MFDFINTLITSIKDFFEGLFFPHHRSIKRNGSLKAMRQNSKS